MAYTSYEQLSYTKKEWKERQNPDNLLKRKLFKAWQNGYLTSDEWVLLYGDDKWLKWPSNSRLRHLLGDSPYSDILDGPPTGK